METHTHTTAWLHVGVIVPHDVCCSFDAPSGKQLGSAGAQAPCWEWPGTAWPSTGCCFAAAPLIYSDVQLTAPISAAVILRLIAALLGFGFLWRLLCSGLIRMEECIRMKNVYAIKSYHIISNSVCSLSRMEE